MKKTRIGTIVLVLCMVFALALPVTAFADDKDFTVVITDADGVAGEPIQVDAVELAEQLADVSGKTVSITLNKDVDAGNTPLSLPADGAYTLDLGEYTLTSSGDTVSNYGELIIQGSGTITTAGSGKGALVNYPGADATAMSGKLVANTWYAVKNMGTMELGGEVEVTTENPNASLIANGWYSDLATDRYTEYQYKCSVTPQAQGALQAESAVAKLFVREAGDPGSTVPETGDSPMLYIFVAIAALCTIGLVTSPLLKRRNG